ncbi:hypothetical protein BT69DRAFT_1203250, partial [Atractiella rhizophila]
LHNHVCDDHVLTGNCERENCKVTCLKKPKAHLRAHSPFRPHVCEICQKTFKLPWDLKRHEKIH